jgi:hypothetical protein
MTSVMVGEPHDDVRDDHSQIHLLHYYDHTPQYGTNDEEECPIPHNPYDLPHGNDHPHSSHNTDTCAHEPSYSIRFQWDLPKTHTDYHGVHIDYHETPLHVLSYRPLLHHFSIITKKNTKTPNLHSNYDLKPLNGD